MHRMRRTIHISPPTNPALAGGSALSVPARANRSRSNRKVQR